MLECLFDNKVPKEDADMLVQQFMAEEIKAGLINKVISKVLANRLKKVTGSIISVNQSAFLKDRLNLDGPLIINKVLAWVKKRHNQAFMLEIDFKKAYDNVNWGFIKSVMEQLGFPSMWCG
ncbi:uncharacterized protein LOC110897683 [Helianthus annuus]|uniref:uncharacterized protein LOC110897683 n=1 Tax=Helianthus annuus TaxID=4232 RepID=UPI000B9097F2|nr:uncharacterized protein LOC110897683 [Helianthus annuus]